MPSSSPPSRALSLLTLWGLRGGSERDVSQALGMDLMWGYAESAWLQGRGRWADRKGLWQHLLAAAVAAAAAAEEEEEEEEEKEGRQLEEEEEQEQEEAT
jgi:hypothetical protein